VNAKSEGPQFGTLFATSAGRKWFSIVVAVMPLFLFAFLSIVNPGYMSHFFSADLRALGLPMLGFVIMLSLVSFLLMRRCTSIIGSGKRLLGTVLATLVMAIVVFPAVLLVLLGPAALMLLAAGL